MSSQRSRGRPRRFTRDEAREIRRKVKAGEATTSQLASQTNTGVSTISKIVKGVGAYSNTL